MKRQRLYGFLTLLIVCILIVAVSGTGKAKNPELISDAGPSTAGQPAAGLPTVNSAEKLRSLLLEAENSQAELYYAVDFSTNAGEVFMLEAENDFQLESAQPAPGLTEESIPATTTSEKDYSKTNLQVEGVDEADLLKTDGQYIYQVNDQELIVARVFPADSLEVVSRISFARDVFSPQELYVDDNYLVLIGNANYQDSSYQEDGQVELKSHTDQILKGDPNQICPPTFYTNPKAKAIIYNLADKSNLQKIREVELEGNYVSSRKIGSNLYFIANKNLYTYHTWNRNYDELQPYYRDTAREDEFVQIDYSEICYFPDFLEPNYLLIAGLDLNQPQKEMQVNTYLGFAETIYTSASHLYVALTQLSHQPVPLPQPRTDTSSPDLDPADPDPSGSGFYTTTTLYKFGLDKGEITYQQTGEVPGTVLNQFSMDEYNNYFRIATTTGDLWRSDSVTKNNVFILDESLQVTGQIEDIAPGEHIYSARFMGERGYLVTFKTTDPFFVLDLQDPTNPQILGALKIPGYSDYLHPYDDTHILAFGKDTVEIEENDTISAYYLGMKLAIFDVSDVHNPVEMFKTLIGDRGTESEILHNHKSLLFDKEKGLLSFPVTLMEHKNPDTYSKYSFLDYGEFTFQGAYVYHVDLEKGFTLRDRITHLRDEDLLKSGRHYYYDYGPRSVKRILFIEDTLYTVSPAMIKANDLASLQEKNSLLLKSSHP